MKFFCLLGVLFAYFLNNPIVHAAESQSIGIVKTVKDHASVIRGGNALTAAPGMKLQVGDTVTTGPQASIGLIFEDDTIVSMGPKSEFVIEKYMFDPIEKKLSFIARMVRGTLSFLSGQIAKLSPDSVLLQIPAATIGMRGTRFLVKVEDP